MVDIEVLEWIKLFLNPLKGDDVRAGRAHKILRDVINAVTQVHKPEIGMCSCGCVVVVMLRIYESPDLI